MWTSAVIDSRELQVGSWSPTVRHVAASLRANHAAAR
jgi:hypothetical protein